MSTTQIAYIVFGIVIVIALALDLGLLSKNHKVISIKAVRPGPEQHWLWAGIEFLLWAWIFLMAYVLTMY